MTKMLARRLFARAVVGVPTVLKLGNGMPPRPPAGYGPPLEGTSPMMLGKSDPASMLREKVWNGLRKGLKPEEERQSRRWNMRQMMGGLDPDLSVLNSMALQHRINRQLDLDEEVANRHRGLRATIIRALGGKPEDFE